MKVLYPESLNQDEYIKKICNLYSTKHSSLDKGKIEEIAALVIERIDDILNSFQEPEFRQKVISVLQDIYEKNICNPKFHEETVKIIYSFYHKKEDADEHISHYIDNLDLSKVGIDEKKAWLNFVSEMTQEVLKEICAINYKAIGVAKLHTPKNNGGFFGSKKVDNFSSIEFGVKGNSY